MSTTDRSGAGAGAVAGADRQRSNIEDYIEHGELEGFQRRIEYCGFSCQPPKGFLPPGSSELALPPSRVPR